MIADQLPWITYLSALFVGGSLAAFATTGLWWTVQRLPQAVHPKRLYAASVFIRLTVVLIVFYTVLLYLGAIHLLVALTGFSVARLFLVSPRIAAAETESHE